MIAFRIDEKIPRFIMEDKNGYAMARAIERALQIMCQTVETGLNTVLNVDAMPEWRLDEMAWELGSLYDYSANIEQKRAWIRDSVPLYSAYGTVQAIYNYLEGVFPEVEVEEGWQYGAPGFHFRVTVGGEWTEEKEAWALRAIEATKNVRSVLDDLSIGSQCNILVKGTGGLCGRIYYPMTGPGVYTGTIPQEALIGALRRSELLAAPEGEMLGRIYYTVAGVLPQENLVGALRTGDVLATPDESGTAFPYPACSNTLLVLEEL